MLNNMMYKPNGKLSSAEEQVEKITEIKDYLKANGIKSN